MASPSRDASTKGIAFVRAYGQGLLACVGNDLVWLESVEDTEPEVVARRGCLWAHEADPQVALDVVGDWADARLLAVEHDGHPRVVLEGLDPGDEQHAAQLAKYDGGALVSMADRSLMWVDPVTGDTRKVVEPATGWSVRGDELVYRPFLHGTAAPPLVVRDMKVCLRGHVGHYSFKGMTKAERLEEVFRRLEVAAAVDSAIAARDLLARTRATSPGSRTWSNTGARDTTR